MLTLIFWSVFHMFGSLLHFGSLNRIVKWRRLLHGRRCSLPTFDHFVSRRICLIVHRKDTISTWWTLVSFGFFDSFYFIFQFRWQFGQVNFLSVEWCGVWMSGICTVDVIRNSQLLLDDYVAGDSGCAVFAAQYSSPIKSKPLNYPLTVAACGRFCNPLNCSPLPSPLTTELSRDTSRPKVFQCTE